MKATARAPATTSPHAKTRPAARPSKRKQRAPPMVEDEAAQEDGPDRAMTDIETEEERIADSIETLPEMERAIGMADWIDPQTGEPAEGHSPPHLEEE